MSTNKNMPENGPNPSTINSLSINKLPIKHPLNPSTSEFPPNLFIEKEVEIDGVGMGVLSDGTAFLSGRGLARLCGTMSPRISELGSQWIAGKGNGMLKGIQKILAEHGIEVPKPYIEVMSKGRPLHAYPDYVCLAVLEYFAFEQPNKIALQNFRKLAGKTLHDFIYTQVGYDPHHHVPEVWRQFHDRVSLVYNAVPAGYFCIFKEMSDIMVYLGQNGLQITNKFVPDISVGRLWADYWTKNRLAETFGERRIYKHNYPDYFPQALSNPQDASCYPEASLGEFRKWMRERYIGGGAFERYLEGQVEKLGLPPSFPQLAVSAFRDKQLE